MWPGLRGKDISSRSGGSNNARYGDSYGRDWVFAKRIFLEGVVSDKLAENKGFDGFQAFADDCPIWIFTNFLNGLVMQSWRIGLSDQLSGFSSQHSFFSLLGFSERKRQ